MLLGNAFSSKECMMLAAQAQAKIAAVDEEVRKLKALQTDLKQKQEALDVTQRNWLMERDRQRLAVAAEREASLIDMEASRKALKRERKRFENDLDDLQNLTIKHEKTEEQNRQLKLSLAQQQVCQFVCKPES